MNDVVFEEQRIAARKYGIADAKNWGVHCGIPVEGVVVDLHAIEGTGVPGVHVDVALFRKIASPAVVGADVEPKNMVNRGPAPRPEKGHAIACGVVSVVVLQKVVVVE